MNMNEKRRVLTAIFAVLLIALHSMSSEVQASGAVLPYPQIMPYVPPNTAQMYDILFNSYGVTAINESNENRKVAAYVDLVTRVLGAGAESYMEELQNMIVQATQTRKVTVSNSMGQSMIDILNSAITQGVNIENESGGGIEFPSYEALAEYTTQRWGMALSRQNYDRFRETWFANPNFMCWINYSQTYGGGQYNFQVWLYASRAGGGEYAPSLYAPVYQYITNQQGTSYYDEHLNGVVGIYCDAGKYMEKYNNLNEFIQGIGYSSAYTKQVLQTKDTATKTSIENGTATIATPFSVVDTQTGIIDDTKPVVIQLPTTLPLPATTTQELADTQEQLGVENVDMQDDVTDVVEGLQTAYAEQYGDIAEYGLNLTELFPFCIPFDIGRILTMFVAEPQAPHFEFELPIGYNAADGVIFGEYEIDLSQFDTVAYWLRKGMLLLFIVGLGMITREKVLRG